MLITIHNCDHFIYLDLDTFNTPVFFNTRMDLKTILHVIRGLETTWGVVPCNISIRYY